MFVKYNRPSFWIMVTPTAVFPDSCAIYILPPSLEALGKRLTGRGQDSDDVIQRRMRDAQTEISHWAEFDQLVVNDRFDTALEELAAMGITLNVEIE